MRTILALIFSLLATAASAQPGPGPTQPWVQNGPLIYYPNGSVNAGTSSLNNTGAGTFNASDGYYLNNSLVQSVTATDAPLNYSAGTLSLNINSSLTVDGSNNLGINLSHANSWLAPQTFSDGATFSAAITYGGVTLSNSVTGTGAMVLSSGSTIANPTFTGSVSAAGLITNTDLAFDYVYVNGVPCTLGVASPGCSITATAANVTVGGGSPTGVINGTPGDILAVGSGPSLTQIAVTGSGSVVLATAPTIAGETVSGTANFTGTFEIGGQAETFPASGLLVGTTDTQSLTNKSIAGSEINSGTVGAAYLPIATSAAQGIVQGDGSTLTISTGVISCTTMTASQIGCGYPDNSTIVVVSGKLTVIEAAASSITIGVTSIGGGTSGDLLSNNSGTLSQVSLGTGFSVSGGAINTPWSYSGVNITSNNSGYVGIGSGEFLIADTVSLPTSPNSGTYLNIGSINGIGFAQEYNYSTSTYGTFDIANLNLAVGTLSIGGTAQYTTPQVYDPSCGTVSGHDCTSALGSAASFLNGSGGGTLYFPHTPYCYLVSGAISFGGNVRISGDGENASQICSSYNGNIFYFNADYVAVENIGLIGPNSSGATASNCLFSTTNVIHITIKNSLFQDCYNGLNLNGAGVGWLENLEIYNNYNFGIISTSGGGEWLNILIEASGSDAIRLTGSSYFPPFMTQIQTFNNKGYGIYLDFGGLLLSNSFLNNDYAGELYLSGNSGGGSASNVEVQLAGNSPSFGVNASASGITNAAGAPHYLGLSNIQTFNNENSDIVGTVGYIVLTNSYLVGAGETSFYETGGFDQISNSTISTNSASASAVYLNGTRNILTASGFSSNSTGATLHLGSGATQNMMSTLWVFNNGSGKFIQTDSGSSYYASNVSTTGGPATLNGTKLTGLW